MAVGDLSPDQARYAQAVAAGTGLDPHVVVAWIGAESGWGVNKPSHNYLNIGPGRSYGSTDQAASAVADLIRNGKLYKPIRDAAAVSPAAQVAAIESSPWDADRYGGQAHRLRQVWQSVTGKGATIDVTGPSGVTPVNFTDDALTAGGNLLVPGLGDLWKGIGKLTKADKIVAQAVNAVGGMLLSLVFTAGALALIGLGLARLTGNNARDLYGKAQQVQGQVSQAATIAAMA